MINIEQLKKTQEARRVVVGRAPSVAVTNRVLEDIDELITELEGSRRDAQRAEALLEEFREDADRRANALLQEDLDLPNIDGQGLRLRVLELALTDPTAIKANRVVETARAYLAFVTDETTKDGQR